MTNQEFILQHRPDDVRTLALKKVPEGVDAKFCLQQIEGWQLARKKLQTWAVTEGLYYPPRISMEQCSSEQTACYKRQVVERLLPPQQRGQMIDLTGGFGVDFSYLARGFHQSTYVERQAHLCQIAQHNFALLNLGDSRVVNGDGMEYLQTQDASYNLIYIDPARRDDDGRKVVRLEDCTPDVCQYLSLLLAKAQVVMIKLSPMLDIHSAIRSLQHVSEVHVVSVSGECKELLLILTPDVVEDIVYHCVNLDTQDAPFSCADRERQVAEILEDPSMLSSGYLFEPNASILKAGVQDALCRTYGVAKLHPCSHLFYSPQDVPAFPGRRFRIVASSDFSKKGLKNLLGNVQKANLTVRNFPTSVALLRKQLKLREGGEDYLFATTLRDGSHVLIRCQRPTCPTSY